MADCPSPCIRHNTCWLVFSALPGRYSICAHFMGIADDPLFNPGQESNTENRHMKSIVEPIFVASRPSQIVLNDPNKRGEMMAPRVILFDVVETMLDTGSLDSIFESSFGSKGVRRQWFDVVQRSVLLLTAVNSYVDFTGISKAALDIVARSLEIDPPPEEKQKVIDAMKTMQPHADVREGLERLREAGFRLAALTNSKLAAAQAALAHAGLGDLFEQVLSADSIRRMKPAPEPYWMAAERLGVTVDRIRLVAAHDWDIAGALRAGCAAAFISRPGKTLHPLTPQPDVVAPELKTAAARIIELEKISGSRG